MEINKISEEVKKYYKVGNWNYYIMKNNGEKPLEIGLIRAVYRDDGIIMTKKEKQIEKITKHTMSNLLTYNDYLVSNLETILDYLKNGNHIFNTKHLNELITDISNQTDSSKLDFYGEQVDMVISNVTHEFGYNHRLEYQKRMN